MQASYSIDENLYHTSFESGILEDPMTGPPPEMFKMTVDPMKVANKTVVVCSGVPGVTLEVDGCLIELIIIRG